MKLIQNKYPAVTFVQVNMTVKSEFDRATKDILRIELARKINADEMHYGSYTKEISWLVREEDC